MYKFKFLLLFFTLQHPLNFPFVHFPTIVVRQLFRQFAAIRYFALVFQPNVSHLFAIPNLSKYSTVIQPPRSSQIRSSASTLVCSSHFTTTKRLSRCNFARIPSGPACAAYHKTSTGINYRYKFHRVSARGLIIRRLWSAALHAGNRSSSIAADFSLLRRSCDCAFVSTTLNNSRNQPCVKCNEQLEGASCLNHIPAILRND